MSSEFCVTCGREFEEREGRYRVSTADGSGSICVECDRSGKTVKVPAAGGREDYSMPDDKPKPNPKPSPLVEDTQTVGGVDKTTGAPVVKPKTPGGKADESVQATDPNERA
jgi:hypothetical protein